jgi:beta-glucuronidase
MFRNHIWLAVATALTLINSPILPARAQSESEPVRVQNPLARAGIDLDGSWNVVIDPFETGYYSHRYEPKADGWFLNQKMEQPWDLIEYNFETGTQLVVPGDWNSQDDRLFFYEGTIWYQRSFRAEPQAGTRYFLHFGAVNYEAKVYVNGALAAEHVGGFTPFDVEVTGIVKSGNNFLVVKADNQRRRNGVPTINTDWWNYGGITRSVRLIEFPSAFIEDYLVQLERGSRREINGWVKLNGAGAGQIVRIEIPEAGVDLETATNAVGVAEVSVQADLTLWSPGNPKLYDVIITSGEDRVVDRIGFRTIERRGEDILLNGQRVFLRGVCIHEEKPFGGGRAATREDAAILLGWASEMEANFVRLAHYPHNEHMVRVADEMGLLVWSEIPVYWTVQFSDPLVYANAENQLTEMIIRDRNRASVVLWSIANETPVSPARTEFLSGLAETARRLDPTRLITAALDTQLSEGNTRTVADPLGGVVDVIGINSYCGWYSGRPESCAELEWKSSFGKPVVMSEFGAGALQGLHGTADDRWTEEYQASVYKNNLKMIRGIPFLRGTTPWILKDFRSPRRPLPRIQDFWNRKGLISSEGVRKEAFDLMKDFYLEMKEQFPDR